MTTIKQIKEMIAELCNRPEAKKVLEKLADSSVNEFHGLFVVGSKYSIAFVLFDKNDEPFSIGFKARARKDDYIMVYNILKEEIENEENKESRMNEKISEVFEEYKQMEGEIEKGIIKKEHIDWVIRKFDMDNMSNKEINDLWLAIDEYFENLASIKDESGNVVGWKPGMRFVFDTDSAWKEVCNYVRRERRAGRR